MLGVSIDDVLVVHGDTAVVQYGIGTFGSRGIAVGGAALASAPDKVVPKARPHSVPPVSEPGVVATHFFEPKNFTFPNGTHICVVEVDKETGDVEILRYVAVDDCGKQINPLIVQGQVHGGIAQGLAQALFEEVVYDENGQLLTGELMDYAVPKAHQLPRYELDHTETPTDVNPLGTKGVGEAGTIGSTPPPAEPARGPPGPPAPPERG